ncbi:MAG: PDZ domain-containing protein [Planctomycetota bacterium]
MRIETLLIVGLVLALVNTTPPVKGATAEPRDVAYRIILERPQNQLATFEVVFPDVPPGDFVIHMPTWRPGRYVMLDPAGTVRRFDAFDAQGNTLQWRKSRRSSWTLSINETTDVTVRYELFANDINVRTRHVNDTHGFFSGSGVFLYSELHRDHGCTVALDIPPGWEVASGLSQVDGDSRLLRAASYDILVDSPIETGDFRRLEFNVQGVPHEITLWGDAPLGGLVTEQRLKDDFAAITEYQAKLFGEIPYDRYVFIIHSGEGLRGGTEHWNSTVMQTNSRSFLERDRYASFLGLTSHEMFHTWNVKRLRPAGLVPYDYQDENLTSLLWVAEGTTTYYDDLTLVRMGLISVAEYLAILRNSIAGYRANPGRHLQTLSASSTDAWTRFGNAGSDGANSTVSFYRKGMLVSLLLDMQIRERTGDAASLDDLMRDLYERHPLHSGGFTVKDFGEAVDRVGGGPAAPFFEAYIDGLESLPLEAVLERCGLKLELNPPEDPEPWIGLRLNGNTVRSARADGPAFRAGLIEADELIAIDGRRLAAGGLTDALARHEIGEPVEVSFFRRGMLRTLPVRVSQDPAAGLTLEKVAEPTTSQRAAFEAWVGQPWDDLPDIEDKD